MSTAVGRIAGLFVLLCVPSAGLAAQASPQREVIRLPGSLEGLPFSSAIRVGPLIYLSGQIGVLPGTRTLASGGTEGQTRQTLENIRSVLAYAGSGMDRVIKCTVFLDDMTEYDVMNRVYATFFPQDPPARSTLGADGLALGAAVEIECIALAGEGS